MSAREVIAYAITHRTEEVRNERDAAIARAEKAEAHIKSLHDAEQATRRILDAVPGEPTADAATRLSNDWVDLLARINDAEHEARCRGRERDEAKGRARRAAQAVVECIGSAGPEDADDAALRIVATVDALRELLAAETKRAETAEAALRMSVTPAHADAIARAEKAERERDAYQRAHVEAVGENRALRAELARLRSDGVDAVFRAGVAHGRARLAAAGVTVATADEAARFEVAQPAKDRATDEELVAIGHAVSKARIFDGSSGGDETIAEWKRRLDLDVVRAVAARVRQECLVAQAVEAGGAHFYRLGPRKWAVYGEVAK